MRKTSRAIEVEAICLFGIVAITGVVGYGFKSCNQKTIREEEITLQIKEEQARAPCRPTYEIITKNGHPSSTNVGLDPNLQYLGTCNPGATITFEKLGPIYMNGDDGREQVLVMCNCINKEDAH